MAEKQLIDHLLKDIQELKVLNNKYQQELETCNHFRIKHLEEKFIEEKEKRVELSQKYEEEQQKSKDFERTVFEYKKDYEDLYDKFKKEIKNNEILKKDLLKFISELEGKKVEKEIKQFQMTISLMN